MTLIKYNPSLRNGSDRGFSNFMDKFFHDSFANTASYEINFNPQVDIAETKTEFEIEFSVPGMKKEDFSIDMKNDQLTISGERRKEEQSEGKNYHTVESAYGKFSRSFYLPENVKVNQIEASYSEGILKITIPKDEKKELVKTIQIK